MANRQWFIPSAGTLFRGGMIDEEGTEEYFVPGVGMINEDQVAVVAGVLNLVIAPYRANAGRNF